MPVGERRATPPDVPGLQLTWVCTPWDVTPGHLVAWQPRAAAYGGNIQASIRSSLGSTAAGGAGSVRTARLRLPDGVVSVMCQRLDASAFVGLAGSHRLEVTTSASVAWCTGVFRLAAELVAAGRVRPHLAQPHGSEGTPWWVASWAPLGTDLHLLADDLRASMPPVLAAAEGLSDVDEVPAQVLTAFVDELARAALHRTGWRAPVSDTRRASSRAVRAVAKALSSPTPRLRAEPALAEAFAAVAAAFADAAQRASAEPHVRLRLQLGLPDGGGEAAEWPLQLDVVDADDAGRWCTRTDLDRTTREALALLGHERWVEPVRERVDALLDELAEAAPWLADWALAQRLHAPAAPSRPAPRRLHPERLLTAEAAATLEHVEVLRGLGVELRAPAGLVRRAPRPAGTARAAAPSSGRFAATALVRWEAVVDDPGLPPDHATLDDALLERAAVAGAQLVEIGGRWVQVGQREARVALEQLRRHRTEHAQLGVLDLLRLSAELARHPDDAGRPAAGSAGHAPPAPPSPTLLGVDVLGDLLAGLPSARAIETLEPPGFAATLRPYQRRGLGWLQFLHGMGLGGCLADDMGLGKTPTTLAHLVALPGPHLVVCPLSVVRNWQQECARFVPLARVMVHHGSGRGDAAELAEQVAQHDIVLTTYQVAARDADALAGVAWSVAVFDEAQAVKNPETGAAKALRRLTARQRIALTGTPVENRLAELWAVVDLVAPGLLGSAGQFRSRFAGPIERHEDPSALRALRVLTAPVLLRRTKADRTLVPDLPDKVEQVAWASLTREQATMYQSVVERLLADAEEATGMRRRGLVLAALTRLKQICNHPAHALGDGSRLAGRSGKLTRFDELVADLLDAGERALVFTQFREMGLLLQRHLGERFGDAATRGRDVPFLHGGVSKAGRDRIVAEFQGGDADAVSPLLIVSLKAGGTGLNLTAASRVVHYDRWWNPAVEDQATDRAWRIGQQRSVFVHKLVCQGTVEERVDRLIADKRALADAVVGTTGERWLSELSGEELRDLVLLRHAEPGR